MKRREIQLPLDRETAASLRAGEFCCLSGELLVARDAAHDRMVQCLEEGRELPVSLMGETVYYMGPSPARPGQVIGSAGPTTAGRMDRYTPALLEQGILGMIGKGRRNDAVKEAIRTHGAVYFAAVGGAGALLSKCVEAAEIVAYEDLQTEAVRRLKVRSLPVVVAVDCRGNDLYER